MAWAPITNTGTLTTFYFPDEPYPTTFYAGFELDQQQRVYVSAGDLRNVFIHPCFLDNLEMVDGGLKSTNEAESFSIKPNWRRATRKI